MANKKFDVNNLHKDEFLISRNSMIEGFGRVKSLFKKHVCSNIEDCKIIHVAGTNGKGSVVSYIESILLDAGYNVGVYTSPHLVRLNERIKHNGYNIDDYDLNSLHNEINSWQNDFKLSFFELITLVAFQYFATKKPDFVILEVGLGGEFDATNIIDYKIASVITSISMDHTNYLGNNISDIAYAKAGIIPNSEIVINGCENDIAINVLTGKAKEFKVKVLQYNNDISCYGDNKNFDCKIVNNTYQNLSISLNGLHQCKNASLAVAVIDYLSYKGFDISNNNIKNGLLDAKNPARIMDITSQATRLGIESNICNIILDGCHNVESCDAFMSYLKNNDNYDKNIGIFAIASDKDIKTISKMIKEYFDIIIIIKSSSDRSLSLDILINYFNDFESIYVADDFMSAILKIKTIKPILENARLCIFGSLFLCGDVVSIIEK